MAITTTISSTHNLYHTGYTLQRTAMIRFAGDRFKDIFIKVVFILLSWNIVSNWWKLNPMVGKLCLRKD